MTYTEFLESKVVIAPESGFVVSDDDLSPALKPHQRDAVKWALHGGRRALFESFGLGKTVQELEYCRNVVRRFGGKALLVLPLGVRQEFTRDAVQVLGIEPPVYVRTMQEAAVATANILMTNYERVRDGDMDPKKFTAAVLDEAAVLRSFGSKTYQTFLSKFRGVPYKLVCTATPSPNRYKELIHYAGFLEVMDTGQALTRFFQRDSQKAGNLTLYPHKEEEFWLWVSSWALFIDRPSDLGYDDTGYSLPPLDVRWHRIDAYRNFTYDNNGQQLFVREAAASLKDAATEKRNSITSRVAKARELIKEAPNDHFILWHDLEAERHAIKRAIPEVVEIYGAQDLEERERNTIEFSEGKTRILSTKKELSGSGCNFQRFCHRAIFVGVDYEFNDFIQAIHRIYRFLQTEQVRIDILYTEGETEIVQVLKEKWQRHDYLTEKMRVIVKKYGLSREAINRAMKRSIGIDRLEVSGVRYTAINNDCVRETSQMADNSVDMILTSIPFSNHYEYTPSYNDFGHNENNERFFEQMDFLSPELLRVLRPGRVRMSCERQGPVWEHNGNGNDDDGPLSL